MFGLRKGVNSPCSFKSTYKDLKYRAAEASRTAVSKF